MPHNHSRTTPSAHNHTRTINHTRTPIIPFETKPGYMDGLVAKLMLGRLIPTHNLCRASRWFGGRGGDKNGEHEVCIDNLIPGQCVVYTAGNRENPSFALALARYGCEVHSFDPTLDEQRLQDLKSVVASLPRLSRGNLTFHDVGFGNSDLLHAPGRAPWQWPGISFGRSSNNKQWEVKTLETLMRMNGHTKLDLFKCDIEGAEWPLLERLLANSLTRHLLHSGELIDQIILDVHLMPRPDTSRAGGWQEFAPSPDDSRGFFSKALSTLGLVSRPPPGPAIYPMKAFEDADHFNWHASDMLWQLQESGFGLLSYKPSPKGPFFDVSVACTALYGGLKATVDHPATVGLGCGHRRITCCHELSFVWKP